MNAKLKATVVCLVLLASDSVLAHSPMGGIGNFYNGLLHPVLVPAHLLLLVTVGLFFGQQGLQKNKIVVGLFFFSTVLGLIAAWFFIGTMLEALVLTLSMVIGLLTAINPKAKLLLCMSVAALAGFFLGFDSAQEALFGKEKLVTFLGSGIAICLLPLMPMTLAYYLNNKTWQKVGIRIAGSWIAASSVLVLALSISKS